MDLAAWNERYLARRREDEDFGSEPARLLVETAEELEPGRALDLACGTGRNALWLARQGWNVTAVDGSEAAIQTLRERARESGLTVDARVADLQKCEFEIGEAQWDLVAMCYYLQRNLFDALKRGLKPGGRLVLIAHTIEAGETATETRLEAGELRRYFSHERILHYREGMPRDSAHRRAVAEVVIEI
jgi:SAM-dependent methyltransferase